MPLYDYECPDCGSFSLMRGMEQFATPQECPSCGKESQRMITLPALAMMPQARRNAFATNERASHEPRKVSGRHGPNCGCCRQKTPLTAQSVSAAKVFPSKRPWMISH